MKTFETEKGNIPEGATHYRDECDRFTFVWVKLTGNKEYVWDVDNWCDATVINTSFEITPIPQANIETPEEKEVLDSIATSVVLNTIRDSGGVASDEAKLIKPREPSKPVITKVEWGGAGLPAVGVECEFSCEGFWGDSEYHWCRFLGLLSDNSYAIEFHHPTSPSRVTCQCFDPQCTSFRKPETPQQREERERAEAIYNMCASADNFTEESHFWAGKFYDLGYKKEE